MGAKRMVCAAVMVGLWAWTGGGAAGQGLGRLGRRPGPGKAKPASQLTTGVLPTGRVTLLMTLRARWDAKTKAKVATTWDGSVSVEGGRLAGIRFWRSRLSTGFGLFFRSSCRSEHFLWDPQ